MKIDFVSDIHTELLSEQDLRGLLKRLFSKRPRAQILVVCGDVGDPGTKAYADTIAAAAKKYARVIVALGNHECYYRTPLEAYDTAVQACAHLENVCVLQNDYYEGEGYVVLGTTLWTDLRPEEVAAAESSVGDFKHIREWSPTAHIHEHHTARAFLKTCLKALQDARARGICVIVATHHAPTAKIIHESYHGCKFGSAFACSDMDALLGLADVWICGHTHKGGMYKLTDTTLIACNPLGYKGENVETEYVVATLHTPAGYIEWL